MKKITWIYETGNIVTVSDAIDAWIEKTDDNFYVHYVTQIGGELVRVPMTNRICKIFIEDI